MTDALIKAVMLALADAPPETQAKVRAAIREAQKIIKVERYDRT